MDLTKLTNWVAAVIIYDKKILIVQGKDGKWGFPAAILGEDEKVDNAILRISKDQLGITVIPAAEIGSTEKDCGENVEIVMFIHVNAEKPDSITISADYSAFRYVSFEEFIGADLAAREKAFLEICAEELKKHLD